MNRYLDDFRGHSTEYLLERRALADGLVPEAHQAIEVVLAERGIPVPPVPKQAITMDTVSSALPRASIPLRVGLGIATIVAIAIAEQLARTWVGLSFTTAVLIYFAYDWYHRKGLTGAQREADQAKRDGVNEMMKAAAEGDISRVREIIAYGGDVNAESLIGSTALMYAAKNNRFTVVELLLASGADPAVKTDKGNTALDFAQKARHSRVCALLSLNPER